MQHLPLWALASLFGAALAGLAWGLFLAVAPLPAEDRRYRDPPPRAFRLLWWPIRRLALSADRRLPAALRDRAERALLAAGLERALQPSQWWAGCCLWAVLLGGTGAWALPALFGLGPKGMLASLVVGLVLGAVWPWVWLRDRRARRQQEVLKALPFFLDLITLCVEAGLNLHGALDQAVSQGPRGPLRQELQKVLRDLRAGRSRQDSLQALAQRLPDPAIARLCQAIHQAEVSGSRLGPVLRVQADQRRAERFQRAEKRALEAPVKMLLPLIAFIFPCTFLVLMFPIVVRMMHTGW